MVARLGSVVNPLPVANLHHQNNKLAFSDVDYHSIIAHPQTKIGRTNQLRDKPFGPDSDSFQRSNYSFLGRMFQFLEL